MSNAEQHPTEHRLFPTGVDERPEAATELLSAREVPLGGPRAMLVRRALPNKDRRLVGAWCFADAYGPEDVASGPGMQVPPHPHTGLQTVSWLVAGEVHHRDSLGSDVVVQPGALNLMTAGHGIAHSEVSPTSRSATLHGAQLWVALPESARHGEPSFESHATLPQVRLGDAIVTVIVGAWAGRTSPATTYTPIVGLEVRLPAGGSVRLPLAADFEHAVLALSDGGRAAGQPLPSGSMLYVGQGQPDVTVAATGVATMLLLGGVPFEEELVMWWNFVGRTHDEIADARKAWQVEREMPPPDRTRFGFVDGHDGFTLPAPELPGVELKPRPRHRAT